MIHALKITGYSTKGSNIHAYDPLLWSKVHVVQNNTVNFNIKEYIQSNLVSDYKKFIQSMNWEIQPWGVTVRFIKFFKDNLQVSYLYNYLNFLLACQLAQSVSEVICSQIFTCFVVFECEFIHVFNSFQQFTLNETFGSIWNISNKQITGSSYIFHLK